MNKKKREVYLKAGAWVAIGTRIGVVFFDDLGASLDRSSKLGAFQLMRSLGKSMLMKKLHHTEMTY